jgi:hypothetical protein
LLALAVAAPAILAIQLWSQAFGLRALSEIFDRPAPLMGAAAVAPPPPAGGVSVPPPVDVTVDPPPPDRHVLKGKIAAPPRVTKNHPRADIESSLRGDVMWGADLETL